jgi:hypothetical protein
MLDSDRRTTIVFALVLAVTLAVPAPAASAPADGAYTYVEMKGGKKIARYAVSVKRTGSKIQIKSELAPIGSQPNMPFVDSRAAIDAATLDLLEYHETAAIGCGAMPYDVTVSGSKAKLGTKSLSFPGIAHYVLDDGQSVPFFLPAEVAVWSDDRAVSLAPEIGAAHVIEPYPFALQPARPTAVPAADRYIALHNLGSKAQSSGLWYDPETLVVDEVDTVTTQWLRTSHP